MTCINKYVKYWSFAVLIIVSDVLTSCETMDEPYSEFIQKGETLYTGKPDSVRALGGNGRIKLTWDLISDPKITKIKIFWNKKADSLIIPVQRTSSVQRMDATIDNLAEGTYVFEIYAFDKDGNSSIKTEVIGNAYAETFANSISNRPLDSATYDPNTKKLAVTWFGASAQAAIIDLIYTDAANVEKKLIIKKVPNPLNPLRSTIWLGADTLYNYKKGTFFKYRTGYLPEVGAIDTFYTAYTEVKDIKELVLVIPPPPPVNLALNRAVSKSSDASAGRATNVTDGNYTTFWQCLSGDRSDLNTWVYIDLGSSETFNEVDLFFTKDQQRLKKVEILYSDDKTNWKTAYVLTTVPTKEQVITFNKVEGRYVKVDFTLDNTGLNMNLGEVEIWNR